MNIHNLLNTITSEEKRNNEFLHLTANEGQMSETARKFLGSKLSERYYMGAGEDGKVFSHPFTAIGFPGIAELIRQAEEATKEMLRASVVNLNCLSGVHAMMCAILSTTEPGDTIMTVHHDHGGHFATTGIIDRVGRKSVSAPYDLEHLKFDAEALAKEYHTSKAKAFYMDVSYYVNPHNLAEIREALGKEAIIIYDASHTMGLILGHTFQDPFNEGVDVICANTHKTLPGPQKGMIAFKNKDFGERANAIINGSLYSSSHTHHLIALAVTLLEMKEFGEVYAKQIIANSNAIGKYFTELGYTVRKANTGRFSENHQVHIFTENKGNSDHLYSKLYDNNITVNFDNPLGKGIFIRFGTQEITRRGMKEKEMKQIVEFTVQSFQGKNIRSEVIAFNNTFKKIHYSFDE